MKHTRDRNIELLLTGRAGIDINTTKAGCTFADIPAFTKSVGGSPANIVQGAARLGLKTGFLGKVAHDGMGEYILSSLQAQGIETKGIAVDRTGARNCIAVTEIISAEQSGGYATGGDAFHHGTYLVSAGNSRYTVFSRGRRRRYDCRGKMRDAFGNCVLPISIARSYV